MFTSSFHRGRMLRLGLAGRKTKEEIYGFSGTGHKVSWCQRRACRGSSQTEAHDWLWPDIGKLLFTPEIRKNGNVLLIMPLRASEVPLRWVMSAPVRSLFCPLLDPWWPPCLQGTTNHQSKKGIILKKGPEITFIEVKKKKSISLEFWINLISFKVRSTGMILGGQTGCWGSRNRSHIYSPFIRLGDACVTCLTFAR